MSRDLSGVLENLPDLAVYELSVSGEVRGWSQAARRLLGFTVEEVIGHHLGDLANRTVAISPVSSIEEAARAGRSESFGFVIRKDGSRFWANEVTVAISDAAGETTGYVRIVRDVTSWKVLQEERDRIFMLSADLICIAGFDGFFKRINPSWTRVLGHSEAELLGRPYLEFVHPDDVAATTAEAGNIARGRGEAVTLSFQNRYRCADGAYRWLDWKVHPVAADQLIYAVARDITAQKSNEQQLADYSRELERSNGELQQFAYVASHDLQEPLRAVVGCMQMLDEHNAGKLDERSTELMGHAVAGAKRMQTLISDLLEYSRVGSKGINRSWVDVRPAVEKALRLLEFAVTESNAVVTVDALPHAWADPTQLAQLFQNLIGNAIKFRADRRPEIHVRAERGERETIFSVRDNGIGIAAEYQARVFGVFQRLNPRSKYPGTGIGLAICKKIVDRHGGRIWIESRAGEGCDFRFTIPDRMQQ